MAKERRTYTDEDKAKILAHYREHGPKVTAEHFNIARSMIQRWKTQAEPAPRTPRKRKWTPEKIAAVLEYLKTHKHKETMQHFKISGAQLYLWRHGLSNSHWKRKKANGAAPQANGLDALPERDALMWLERWRQAYFDRLKAETPSAASVLAALRGGK